MYVGSLTCSDVGDASFYLEFIAVFDDTSSVNSVTSGVGDAEESVRKVASILEITTTVTLGESTVVNNDDGYEKVTSKTTETRASLFVAKRASALEAAVDQSTILDGVTTELQQQLISNRDPESAEDTHHALIPTSVQQRTDPEAAESSGGAQENKVTKVSKAPDVKYKDQESTDRSLKKVRTQTSPGRSRF